LAALSMTTALRRVQRPAGWLGIGLLVSLFGCAAWQDLRDGLGHERARPPGIVRGRVEPAPSEKQIGYVESLVEQLRLSEAEVAEIVGEGGPSELRTAERASEIIEQLKTRLDEERPPSEKQLRWIEDLLEETETTRDEAAEMVDLDSFDDLTGGKDGTASALIDALLEITRREKAGAG